MPFDAAERSFDPVKELDQLEIAESRYECEGSLYEFLRQAWPHFESTPFVPGKHIEAICEHLEAVSRGEIKRLIINIPPRHAKTSIVSIAWPTWTWAKRGDPKNQLIGPKVRFLCASYAAGKAQQDAVTARRLIGTRWYQDRWGKRVKITRDRDNQEQYDVEAGGYRISTGIPESLGKGGLIRIWDDPHKTGDVESELLIEKQVRDYNEVWRTRTNDPAGGAEVGVMQRLGKGDLTGFLLESEEDQDITHLCLAALYDPAYHCETSIGWSDWRTEKDESLWPERHPTEWYLQQKRRIGSFAFAGQYQQLPAPRGGGIIKKDWWQLWPPPGEEKFWGGRWPNFYYVCAYLDTAFTTKNSNAWCALTVWGVFSYKARTRIAMIAGWRERPTLSELVTQVRKLCEKWSVDNLIIENKAGAEWVRQEIQTQMDKRSIKFTITLDEPVGDKVARAHAVSAQFEEKMIFAPDKEWAEMVIGEVEDFPKGRWKDLTDTVTGAVGFLRRSNLLEMDVDAEEREAEENLWRGKRESVAESYFS